MVSTCSALQNIVEAITPNVPGVSEAGLWVSFDPELTPQESFQTEHGEERRQSNSSRAHLQDRLANRNSNSLILITFHSLLRANSIRTSSRVRIYGQKDAFELDQCYDRLLVQFLIPRPKSN